MGAHIRIAMFLYVVCTVWLGCAESHCGDRANQGEADCQPRDAGVDMVTPPPAFAVTPLRLPIDATTEISIDAGPAWAKRSISIQQAGAASSVLGTLDGQGKLTAMLSVNTLKAGKFAPGVATFAISGNPADVTARIFLSPQLPTANSLLPTLNVSGDCSTTPCVAHPTSIGIFARSIVAVNYYSNAGMNLADLNAYSIGTNMNKPTVLLADVLRFGDQPIGVAVTDMEFFTAHKNNNTPLSWLCTSTAASGSCKGSALPVMANSSVASLAANIRGATKLFAGIVNGKVVAYSQPDWSDASSYEAASSDPNGKKSATVLGVGDLTGDANPELIIWYPDGSPSVYTGKTLQYSAGYSKNLQLAQKGAVPTAVAVGDMDGDGLDDVVLAAGKAVIVILNQGDGTFQQQANLLFANSISAVAIGDTSKMGKQTNDIVVADQAASLIAVLENKATY